MGIRPASCYSGVDNDRANTRWSRKKAKQNYVGTSPGSKIRQYNMGNPLRKYDTAVDLITTQKVAIRDNALESLRINLNRRLTNKIGNENFFMRLRAIPHHILRENKQAQGAGADRVSQGMSHSFGKMIGRAARVSKNRELFSLLTDEKYVKDMVSVMKTVQSKAPCKMKIKVHKDLAAVGTMPKKVRVKEEEKVEAVEGAVEGEEKKEEKGAEVKGKKVEVKKEEKVDNKKSAKKK